MADKPLFNDAILKGLTACGIAMLLVDVSITVWLAALDPQYSHTQQFISELGEDGRPYAMLFNVWSFIYALLFAGLAVAIGRGLNSRLVLISLLAIAVCSLLTGVIPCDAGCAGDSPAAEVHFLTGYVSLPAIILTPLFAWFATRKSPSWRGYGAFTLAATIVLLLGSLWLATCHFAGRERDGCAVGLAQRLIVGTLYVWLIAVAVRSGRLAGKAALR